MVTNWLAENLILGMDFITRYEVVLNAINKSISYRIDGSAVAALAITLPWGTETNVEVKVSQLDPQQTCQLKNLLIKYSDIFAEKITELGSAKNFEHRIITTGPPISFRPHRGIPTLKPVIKQHVDELLKSGIIRKSRSPYGARIVMVRKPKDNSWRVCIDYRALNKVSQKDSFPLPLIADCLDMLHGAKYFSALDCLSGYHQAW